MLIKQLANDPFDPGMRMDRKIMKADLGGTRVNFDEEEGLLTRTERQKHITTSHTSSTRLVISSDNR